MSNPVSEFYDVIWTFKKGEETIDALYRGELSIDKNDIDAYAQAVIDVTKSVSRAVYKDGFEEELINYIDEGKQTLDNIRKLIETHPYTTNKGISDNSIETTKQLYTDKTNEILEKINNFVEE